MSPEKAVPGPRPPYARPHAGAGGRVVGGRGFPGSNLESWQWVRINLDWHPQEALRIVGIPDVEKSGTQTTKTGMKRIPKLLLGLL